MAQIELTPGTLIVRIEGGDRLWALKSQLDIPLAHVAGAEPAEAEARKWLHGIRLGGVHLPGMISAGTFYEHGQWMFWDVHHPERAIAIAVRDEHYSRLVVEVDDPAAAVAAIGNAAGASAGTGGS
jgi:hypothetical protein